jgi:hypothetical protein
LGFEAILVELSEPLLCFLEGKGEVFWKWLHNK